VALSLLLAEVLPPFGASLVGAGHLHHGLRGGDADADLAFCEAFAAGLAIPLVVERSDVALLARERRLSLETAGHQARRAFLTRAAAEVSATRIATGHTRNDQAETFLMRALRGAGLRGLGGIRPARGNIIRPLLTVSRADVLEYLAERGQSYREDSTNLDRRILRNRIRHEVLPWLEQHEGPGVADALARAARLAAADAAFLEQQARRVIRSTPPVVLRESDGRQVEAAALSQLPLALRRRVVLHEIEAVSGRVGSLSAVDRALSLLDSHDGDRVCLRGVEVSRHDGWLVFAPARARAARGGDGSRHSGLAPPRIALSVPGEASLPRGGRLAARLESGLDSIATVAAGGDVPPVASPAAMATLDADRCRWPLSVRYRRVGDRLQPLGLGGHKKLQDLLVDRKIRRDVRDKVPLVVDADDRILWVAGHAVAEAARVTPATTSVLLLQYWQ
jgi:tRNA(Ile)-lysidine synthase